MCLDHLKSAKTQREQYIGTWLPEPIFTEQAASPEPEETETLSMAFMVLLENLSRRSNAPFSCCVKSLIMTMLRLPKSSIKMRRTAAVTIHLAKQYLVERRPRFEPSSDEQIKRAVHQFMQATVEGDMEALTHTLAQDIVMYADSGGKAPAARIPQRGHEAVTRLLLGIFRWYNPEMRVELHDINGSISLVVWQADALILVMNFEIVDNQITCIRNVINPDKLAPTLLIPTHRLLTKSDYSHFKWEEKTLTLLPLDHFSLQLEYALKAAEIAQITLEQALMGVYAILGTRE